MHNQNFKFVAALAVEVLINIKSDFVISYLLLFRAFASNAHFEGAADVISKIFLIDLILMMPTNWGETKEDCENQHRISHDMLNESTNYFHI